MMKLREYKADLERETGERLSMVAARALYSQYREHEAEAIAGGRDDIDHEMVERQRQATVASKPFKVVRETLQYHPSTDACVGSVRRVVDSFWTREEAKAAMQVMDCDDETSLWVEWHGVDSLPKVSSSPLGETDDIPF